MGPYPLGTQVTLFFQFTDDGTPADPDTVTFTVERPNGVTETFVAGVDSEVTNPSVGYYECLYVGPIAGTYNYKIVGTGTVAAVSETYSFELLPDAIGAPPAFTLGPCEPWIDPQDVALCCDAEVGSNYELFAGAARAATEVLFPLSGRQFHGVCERTVRAGQDVPCGLQVLSRGHIVGWDGSFETSAVLLPNYPVVEITEVKIDGSVLDVSEYRLDRWRWLERKADSDGNRQVWPAWGRADRDTTEEDTFSVSYRFGANPPTIGVLAASQLACEIYKSCPNTEGVDAACKIPKNATRVTRQGVTIEMSALSYSQKERAWVTGMDLVDKFLNATNPNGLKRRPMIVDPAETQFAYEVGA